MNTTNEKLPTLDHPQDSSLVPKDPTPVAKTAASLTVENPAVPAEVGEVCEGIEHSQDGPPFSTDSAPAAKAAASPMVESLECEKLCEDIDKMVEEMHVLIGEMEQELSNMVLFMEKKKKFRLLYENVQENLQYLVPKYLKDLAFQEWLNSYTARQEFVFKELISLTSKLSQSS